MVVLVQITVRDIHGQEFQVQVQNDAQVLGLKLQIWEQRQIAPDAQRLVFGGRQLQDDEQLNAAGVNTGSVVFMVQQGEQTQAVQPVVQPMVQQPIARPAQPVQAQTGFAPHVQAMNVQMPPRQPGGVAPLAIVAQPAAPEPTCCFCIPLRAGVMVLIVCAIISHLWQLSQIGGGIAMHNFVAVVIDALGLIGLLFDCGAIYGWVKKSSKWLVGFMCYMIFDAVLSVAMTIVVTVHVTNMTYHEHKHSHGQTTSPPYYGTTTTDPPHHLSSKAKDWIIGAMVVGILIGLIIKSYYIHVVYRYAKELRAQEEPQRVNVVNGVMYQQV